MNMSQIPLRLSFPAQSRTSPLRASRSRAARRPRYTLSRPAGGSKTKTRALALAGCEKYDPVRQNRLGGRSHLSASKRTPSFLESRAARPGLFTSHALTYSYGHPP
ncbi:MAG: hypothetical protein ACOY40_05450 [Bacillota bacterium]